MQLRAVPTLVAPQWLRIPSFIHIPKPVQDGVLGVVGFFTRTEKEKGFGRVLVRVVIAIPFFTVTSIFINEIRSFADVGMFLAVSVWYSFLLLVASFLILPVLHYTIKIYGGKGAFDKTYQAYMYGLVPQIALGAIPFVGLFMLLVTAYLQITGLSKVHGLNIKKTIAASVVSVVLFLSAGTTVVLVGVSLI